ncbi:MAG: endonuclease/exonuclease/phosphatase family protein [Bacteroidota bacterium]
MTYNIRLNTPSDGENAWPKRRAFLASQIEFHQPDVLGIQEGLPDQVDWLSENLEDYDYVGEGRQGGHAGEYSAIFYRSEELKVLRSGTYWLSETPDTVSTGWDAALPRICTWAAFETKVGVKFMAFNTHFDHVGAEARKQSADLILKNLKTLNPNSLPSIVMGDLNLTPETEPIQQFKDQLIDVYDAAPIKLGPAATFTGFNTQHIPCRRIDYIFVSEDFYVDRMATLTDFVDGRYASDHFAVICYLGLDN